MLIRKPIAEITDHLLMFGTSGYPLFLYNGGSECTLFEGGVGAMGPLLLEQMEQKGVGKDFVKQLVITHAHPDHVMAVPFLRASIPGLSVVASSIAARTLAAEKAIGFFRKIDVALTASLVQAGLITAEHCPQPFPETQILVDRTVQDGDTIVVDNEIAFRVLETPGHSVCSLSFHEPNAGILIVADATGLFFPEHRFWWPMYFASYGDYRASLDRLAGLEANVLCLSHNAVVQGAGEIAAYFRDAIAATEEYHQRIVQRAPAGEDASALAEQLGSEVYEKTRLLHLDFLQKNCALLVKQSLQHARVE